MIVEKTDTKCRSLKDWEQCLGPRELVQVVTPQSLHPGDSSVLKWQLSNKIRCWNLLVVLLKHGFRASDSVCPEQGPRTCISDKSPDDSDAAGLGMGFENSCASCPWLSVASAFLILGVPSLGEATMCHALC